MKVRTPTSLLGVRGTRFVVNVRRAGGAPPPCWPSSPRAAAPVTTCCRCRARTAPAGAPAVLDEARGGDAAVLAQANERARLSGGRIVPRVVRPARIGRRDLRLVEDLPPPKHFIWFFHEESTRLPPAADAVLADPIAEARRRDGWTCW